MKFEIGLTPNFASALLSWYDANGRELPWRGSPGSTCGEPVGPYAVLVSEFMLQQTTVQAVIPYFDRWMSTYPTVKELAAADLDEVLLQWEGLGYYSRARNLHATAGEIASRYKGVIPRDLVELVKLPGIGDYTAAAVASIAYGVRAPALDANNFRVWSRLLASSGKERIAKVFGRVIPADRPGDFNQALMDLGSSICTPKTPDCPQCPLAGWCRAFRGGRVSDFPPKKIRPETEHIEAAIGIILKDGEILVQKRADTGLMAGLWEFPGGKLKETPGGGDGARGRVGEKKKLNADGCQLSAKDLSPMVPCSHAPMLETPEEAVVREVREETGLSVNILQKLGVFTHAYTKFRVKLHVFICERTFGRLNNPSAKWVTLEELEELAMPSVNRRIVKKLEGRLKAGCGG